MLLAVRSSGGAAALSALAIYYVGSGTAPASVPSWVTGPNSAPTTAPQPPATLPDFWRVDAVASAIVAANAGTLSIPAAQTIANQCLARASYAGLDASSECKSTPMFVTGQDGTTDEATDHDAEAIASYPAWVRLDYRPGAENPSYSGWQRAQPECASEAGKQCDEYPFFASSQGGGQATPRPHLKMINKEHNEQEGRNYNSFLAACGLYAAPANDREFLVIPMPSGSGVPTLNVCNNG